MLSKGNFWAGVLVGVAVYYGWQRYGKGMPKKQSG
jgi:tRNA(Glu) U13 pseudouridine synthase TruD